MDARILCLGVLLRKPASGYEIRKQFEEGPFNHFYDTSYGSIYPALKALERDALIRVAALPDDGGRTDKKLYEITQAGREKLMEALVSAPERDKLRSDFLFILSFAEMLPPRHVERLIDQRLEFYREHLNAMQECAAENGCTGKGAEFVRGFGMAVYTAAAEYLEEHRDELEPEEAEAEHA